jgi:dihydroorotate dehydrogenase electron transfer subunit
MENFSAAVLRQTEIALGYREMVFSWPEDLTPPLAGQFLTVKATENPAPLLRRPFALSDFNKKDRTASIIYQIRGSATRLMAEMAPGKTIEVLSPLGNSFSIPETNSTPLLVAGGIGLGPILYLARALDSGGMSPRLVFGCRSQSYLPDLGELENGSIHYCTDDGSAGYKGTSVDFLRSLDWDELASPRLYACGPQGMLKACHDLAVEKGIPSESAMEEMMACGVGACMGCVVEINGPKQYARVCKDGPVFDSRTVKWT